MKYLAAIILGAIMATATDASEPQGIIARSYENDLPVIYRFVDELPPAPIRKKLPWLVVVSWSYDGSSNNGMPPSEINQQMIALEDAISDQLERDGYLRHAYSRTGNNLKELVYYINDRDDFIESLNSALASHSSYPIEITFYEDAEWKDLEKLRRSVSGGEG